MRIKMKDLDLEMLLTLLKNIYIRNSPLMKWLFCSICLNYGYPHPSATLPKNYSQRYKCEKVTLDNGPHGTSS